MKHFIIEIIYTVPFPEFEHLVPEHRTYLQTGFDNGMLLFSGPQIPRQGGVAIGRAGSLEEMTVFFDRDPYCLNGVARYRFIEFNPGKRQPFLDDWFQ